MTKEFHSLAYFLKDETAHFYHYHLGVQDAVEAQGIPFYAHIKRDANLCSLPKGWHKTFHGFHNKKERRKFFKDCLSLFRKNSTNERIFFLEFFGRRDFALFALSALLTGKKSDSLWILYRDDLTTRRKKDLTTIRFFSKLLQLKFKRRFTPLTDSEALASYYQRWFTKPISVLPIMHTQYLKIKAPSTRKKRLTLSWPGAPRPEKGLKEVQRLTQVDDAATARFTLELAGATPFPPLTNDLDINLQRMQLSEEEYFANLKRADALLLPYDERMYKWRTSGIFVEAVAAGKMPLVKEGSWLAQELIHNDLPELIVDFTNPHFFTDLYKLLHNPEVQKKFARMQENYKTYHCKKHFQERLTELFAI